MNEHGPERREAIRPAVDELADHQEELFEELEEGFADGRGLLLWLHKASVRTLGRIPDEWAVEVLASRYQRAALLGEEIEFGPDQQMADFERSLMRDDVLLDACIRSTRFMARQAGQYADAETEEQGRKFGPQRWLLMRPALDELVTRQRTALERVLAFDDERPRGLEDHDDISTWVRSVLRASRGIDGGITREAIWSRWWRQALLGDPTHVDLHLDLASDVLSVFNAAIREEAVAADESADEEKVQRRSFST